MKFIVRKKRKLLTSSIVGVLLLVLISVSIFRLKILTDYEKSYLITLNSLPVNYRKLSFRTFTSFGFWLSSVELSYSDEKQQKQIVLENIVDTEFQDLFELNRKQFLKNFCEEKRKVDSAAMYTEDQALQVCTYKEASGENGEFMSYMIVLDENNLANLRDYSPYLNQTEVSMLLNSLSLQMFENAQKDFQIVSTETRR